MLVDNFIGATESYKEQPSLQPLEFDDGEFLSYDLVPSILTEADNETIFTCFCVSKSWNLFANDNYLFQQLNNKRYDMENYKKYCDLTFSAYLLLG
jgi:hypothetical protein